MEREEYSVRRYEEAVSFLPGWIRDAAGTLARRDKAAAEEIRLRTGRPPTVLLPEGEREVSRECVTKRDLDILLELASGASAHSVSEQMRYGYITLKDGFRLGLCGTAILRNGEISAFSALSSAVLRISREMKGISGGILTHLVKDGHFRSALIVAPPGGGKTTLLRDMVRQLSDGFSGLRPLRLALCDERGEVIPMSGGVPQMDAGKRTDILSACPKAEAAEILLRVMNPEVIAMDEITAQRDIEAISKAANCGVKLIASAHGSSPEDLYERPLYRRLLELNVFENAVFISVRNGVREYRTEMIG